MAAKSRKRKKRNTSSQGQQRKPSRGSKEESGITQVDLKQYKFFPPGPMGWTAREYEKLIENLQKKGE